MKNESINNLNELNKKKSISQNKISPYNKLIINLNIFILFSFSIGFYNKSLSGCEYTENECLKKYGYKFFINLAFQAIISSLMIITIIFLIFHNYITFKHLIYIIPSYLYIFYTNQGSDLNNHGSYNTFFYILFIILGLIIFEYFYRLFFYIRFRKKIGLIIILFFTFSIICFVLFSNKEGCKNWDKGLGNVSIINNENSDSCYIKIPKKCKINMFKGLIDLNIFSKKCKSTKSERKYLNSFINKKYIKSNILSYPITTHVKFPENWVLPEIQNYILKNMNNETENKEIILTFDKYSKGTISINIKPNETLIKEREELTKKYNTKFDNIIIIYIDSISRPEFYRSLPKTASLINSIYYKNYENENKENNDNLNKQNNKKTKNLNNKNNKSDNKFKHLNNKNIKNTSKKIKNYFSYQFLKYHSMAPWTCINIDPMFYGRDYYKNKGGKSIITLLKNKGFITAQSINMCTKEFYDIEKGDFNLPYENYDHENYGLFCDPNIFEPNNYFGPFKGPYSFKKKCLYGKDTFEYVIEYGKKFLESYKNQKKFIRLGFIDAHEGSMEVIKYIDKSLYNFLLFLLENDNLNNKKNAIFIISDHGNNMLGIYNALSFEDFMIEKTLGVLFLILPNINNNLFNQSNLIFNEQKFITPYDIYYTLNDMINEDNYLNVTKHSLFIQINGLERDCTTYRDVRNKTCSCVNYKKKKL